jgi:predicted ABC-type ATPase
MPDFYIIAGPNGAGKTTASYTILPNFLDCFEFINADEIANSIAPQEPEKAAFEASRIMLGQIDKHLELGVDFAVETTLSSKHYANIIKKAKNRGYSVSLIFLWLESFEAARERVKKRVEKGGHSIPPEVIKRRYTRGLYNFFHVFVSLCDNWILFDNNGLEPLIIASGETETEIEQEDKSLFEKIKERSNEHKY